jgi:KamA family protein
MQYKAYSLRNLRTLPQIANLSEEQIRDIEIVGSVLPFRVNSYVAEMLIDWSKIPEDPVFVTTFPQKGMLLPGDYDRVKAIYESGADSRELQQAADEIRMRLNPHPAGQLEHNAPIFNEQRLYGVQHKYRETVLVFPEQGQTCHAYCTFCFRWPQFTGMKELRMPSREIQTLLQYLDAHPEVTDVLFTGGDPMVMKAEILSSYIEPLLDYDVPHLRTIRIGTRALTYWPYRFTTDEDADGILSLFRRIRESGRHLALMAQFNHPVELEPDVAKEAIGRIQDTGAVIRTQSPLLRHINDSPQIWAEMWRRQIALNCIPYYMFLARDTGAQHYFSVPLIEAWQLFRQAYQSVSGLCRTVRGPIMSCLPGKIQILGVGEVHGKRVFVMRMIQGRNPDWVDRPFFADYDEQAAWYDELSPAFGQERFFYEDELDTILQPGEIEADIEY